MATAKNKKTTVGTIHEEVLAYTAGEDIRLDGRLVEVDCLGSAAHAAMLSKMKVKPPILKVAEYKKIRTELAAIIRLSQQGKFKIKLTDQDVHLAVERHLTRKLGELGKKIHTARSRNDQVALDLRLFAKTELLELIGEAVRLSGVLVKMGEKHQHIPMVGRTHMQPAMPSSIGLWATAFAEELLQDISGVMHAYMVNDQSPLGSAAGYGVPLEIDRQLVSDLLGFSRPCHNVLYACNMRGKNESVILDALGQVMLTLSRLSQDLIIFSMPEFGYFNLPVEYGTGSSIMPQKNNPDVLEIMRAKASVVLSNGDRVKRILEKSLSGYNRDIQETKAPFMDSLVIAKSSLSIMANLVSKTKIDRKNLLQAFEAPGVFATDRALELVGQGVPFRDAYNQVKETISELQSLDPVKAIAQKRHLGASAGLDFEAYQARISEAKDFVSDEQKAFKAAIRKLLG